MCGLKLLYDLKIGLIIDVTPYVGVWIETMVSGIGEMISCHTLRGCVD